MTHPLAQLAVEALEDAKGQEIVVLDVSKLTDLMDAMVVASGSSTRQVAALVDRLLEWCRAAGIRPLGIEGLDAAQWVLVDLGDVVVHVMLPETRAFYELEKLWSVRPPARG